MRLLICTLLVVSAAVAGRAADTRSLSGTWNIPISIVGNDSDFACTFTQKDTDLTGTCKTEQGTVELTGKVTQDKVNWSYKSEYNGSPLTVAYTGTLDSAGKITGTVKVDEFNVEGDFTASPAS